MLEGVSYKLNIFSRYSVGQMLKLLSVALFSVGDVFPVDPRPSSY